MAAKSSSSALDPLNKLKVKIAFELTRVDVRVIKSAILGKIPNADLNKIDPKEEVAGLELLDYLQLSGFLSENNLSLLKEALETANRIDLIKKVEEFEKTITVVTNAPLSLMNELPAPGSDFLHLLITGQESSIGPTKIHELKESLSKNLDIKQSEVPYVRKTETNQDCTFVILQFPQKDEQVAKLIFAAVNKEEWLLKLGVLQLKINGKAPISIDENVVEIKQVQPTETRRLEMKEGFLHHCDKALDLVLVVEFPFSVTPHILKQMMKYCQSAIHALSRGFDMKLAIVTYGNHCSSQPTEVTAFLQQEFSNNFDFISHIKNKGQCGGEGGPSGLADALAKVTELNVRKEATKLCILINFLVEGITDLEYYRCSHGNDAIKLCDNLAGNGVTLYIFGVPAPHPGLGVTNMEKNYFLEGVAHIGGGRYFQLENVGHLDQAITCVTRHDISIEKQGKATGDFIKNDIIKNHGVIRFKGLPRDLQQKLTQNGISVDVLKENGKNLQQVSKLAEKVSLSDNMDEAVESLGTSKSKEVSRSRACKGRSQVHQYDMEVGGPSGMSKSKPSSAKERKHQNCSISLVEHQPIDFECAVRILRRQLHRLTYVKITDPQDQEMMDVDNKDIKH